MNMIYNTKLMTWVLALSALFAFASCEKDDEEPQGNGGGGSTQEEVQNYPTVDGDGHLVAIKSISTTDTPLGPIELTIGTAVAIFTDDSFQSFMPAGDVSLNGQALTLNPNSSYVFTDIGVDNPTGLDFSSDVDWDVSGGNGIPAFTNDALQYGFPTVGSITSATTVDRSMGYTLSAASVSGADSVLFLIGGIAKTIAGNANTCQFQPEDLDGLATGASVVQVAAYTTTQVNQSGKTVYFTNETVQTLSATVQ